MEPKGQYTAGAQVNSKPSTPDGVTGTSATKADAAAIMCSVIDMLQKAGWQVRIGSSATSAYLVVLGARWDETKQGWLLVEAQP